ncbi:hypothetical protein VTJ49DRAFT_3019 [Mycothermus thermophilus]|uniref:Uncharacterized protein n=1 Tax=Humicola insolens TaxID=85995 RepID=A0ABR3V8N0_HUMIN
MDANTANTTTRLSLRGGAIHTRNSYTRTTSTSYGKTTSRQSTPSYDSLYDDIYDATPPSTPPPRARPTARAAATTSTTPSSSSTQPTPTQPDYPPLLPSLTTSLTAFLTTTPPFLPRRNLRDLAPPTSHKLPIPIPLVGKGKGKGKDGRREAAGAWRPEKLPLRPLWPRSGGELEDEWYEKLYGSVWERVWGFAQGWFGYGDMPGLPGKVPCEGGVVKGAVWRSSVGRGGVGAGLRLLGKKKKTGGERGFDEEFRWFVSQVAVQDNHAGGWDAVLLRRGLREAVVAGVVSKVLEEQVWDELLFGGSKKQRAVLKGQDEGFIQYDGYQRTYLRSQVVRTMLVGDQLTPGFWSRVDKLALQTTALLLPLLRLMDQHFRDSHEKPLQALYQDLHDIIAEAAFLSLGIRWSRDIFYFKWPTPGEVWETDQEALNREMFKTSERAAERYDRIQGKRWEEERQQRLLKQARRQQQLESPYLSDQLALRISDLVDKLKSVVSRDNNSSDKNPNRKDDDNEEYHAPHRIAKVHIAAFPTLQRFRPVGGVDQDTGHANSEAITTLMDSRVVHYYGLSANAAAAADGLDDRHPTLEEWLKQTGSKWSVGGVVRWLFSLLAAWMFYNFLRNIVPGVRDVVRAVEAVFLSLVAALIQMVGLVVGALWDGLNMAVRWELGTDEVRGLKTMVVDGAKRLGDDIVDSAKVAVWSVLGGPESGANFFIPWLRTPEQTPGWLDYVPWAKKVAEQVPSKWWGW